MASAGHESMWHVMALCRRGVIGMMRLRSVVGKAGQSQAAWRAGRWRVAGAYWWQRIVINKKAI
ncbi:MAG: hypothetical protein ACRCXB_20960 [Aeromonadaceae bacterium]